MLAQWPIGIIRVSENILTLVMSPIICYTAEYTQTYIVFPFDRMIL